MFHRQKSLKIALKHSCYQFNIVMGQYTSQSFESGRKRWKLDGTNSRWHRGWDCATFWRSWKEIFENKRLTLTEDSLVKRCWNIVFAASYWRKQGDIENYACDHVLSDVQRAKWIVHFFEFRLVCGTHASRFGPCPLS